MGVDMSDPRLRLPKGEKRATTKRRKDRSESVIKRRVRKECVEADGYCRLAEVADHRCMGRSEWAHLGSKKRARTRGQQPDERHTFTGSLMLCAMAHRAYDAGEWAIEPENRDDGASGPLLVTFANGWTARVSARPIHFQVWR